MATVPEQFTFDPARGDEPTCAVAKAVASNRDMPVTQLPPIHHSVDTEALNRLVTDSPSLTVTVSVDDLTLEIDAAGVVRVLEEPANPETQTETPAD